MAKSNGRSSIAAVAGGRHGAAIVDVVHRRQAHRLAKLAFIVTWATMTPVVMVAVFTLTDVFMAAAVGILSGLVAAGLVGLLVLAWPGLRLVWWWTFEITTLVLLLGVYFTLATASGWPAALGILVGGLGLLLVLPPVRRWLVAWCWCVICRHRLRTCFATFIRVNRYGSLPLILFAWPTPAGERIWVCLRPGLSMADLTEDGLLSRLAVGCWAHEVRVARAFHRFAPLIRVDITRRNPLSGTITSPLLEGLPDLTTTTGPVVTGEVSGLNLADIPEPHPGELADSSTSRSSTTTASGRRRDTARSDAADPARRPVPMGRTGEDLTDWL